MAFASDSRRWALVVVLVSAWATACSKSYRIGEHVWVNWQGSRFRAFVIEKTGDARLRVQFEGCDGTWQREVAVDQLAGRVAPSEAAHSPTRIACAPAEPATHGSTSQPGAPYKAGDRIRVKWRGSVYLATVLQVQGPDRILIHYEGFENAWDEAVSLDRVEGAR